MDRPQEKRVEGFAGEGEVCDAGCETEDEGDDAACDVADVLSSTVATDVSSQDKEARTGTSLPSDHPCAILLVDDDEDREFYAFVLPGNMADENDMSNLVAALHSDAFSPSSTCESTLKARSNLDALKEKM